MINYSQYSLGDWLQYLESLHPREIDLGLERVKQVAFRLAIEQPNATVITVAGTNGKGSCVAVLEHLLLIQGVSVGTYTSPHLLRYNERVRCNGVEVEDAALIEAFCKIEEARAEISLTYFEFGTLAAFLIFAQHTFDYWLLEVGLGGRLDAVNLLDPDIAVVTSIDLDHEAWLGDTREAITREKLGILRHGGRCVFADPSPTENTFDIFHKNQTRFWLINRDFHFIEQNDGDKQVCFTICDAKQSYTYTLATPNLPLTSVAAALQALVLCEQLPENALLEKQLPRISLPGRFDVIQTDNAQYILDVAHNPAATKLLTQKLSTIQKGAVIAIVGMMRDKNIRNALAPLIPVVDYWMPVGCESVKRFESAENLGVQLSHLGCKNYREFPSVELAMQSTDDLHKGSEGSHECPVILIFGSFITVASAYEFLHKTNALSRHRGVCCDG